MDCAIPDKSALRGALGLRSATSETARLNEAPCPTANSTTPAGARDGISASPASSATATAQHPTPTERRFTNAHETMIWAARDENAKGYTFNYEALKAANEDVQARSDWLIPLCTGEERLKGADGKKVHPTQKPEGLLARVLLSSSRPGDLVIDPFNGTGTTGAVAKRLGRRYIGFERDKAYARAAEARIAAIEPLPEATLAPFMTARDAPRVAFSELIERGMISPGTKLFDARKRHGALVRQRCDDCCIDSSGTVRRRVVAVRLSQGHTGHRYCQRDPQQFGADRERLCKVPFRSEFRECFGPPALHQTQFRCDRCGPWHVLREIPPSGGQNESAELAVPAALIQKWPALTSLEGAPAYNVGRAYAAFAADIANGTHTVPDFADAVRRHELIAAIERSAASGERVKA